jgi:hypothetical protein
MSAAGTLGSLFFRARLWLLASILLAVAAWALLEVRSRRARRDWDHTLNVAVVILQLAPLDEAALPALRARSRTMETRLAAELQRYRAGAPQPVSLSLFGPLAVTAPPPQLGGDGILERASHAYAQWRYLRGINAAAGVDAGTFDSRIYVTARPANATAPALVEGASEDGGRVGTVAVDLDAAMADLALIVITHELLHTLGATDKYDATTGKVQAPAGLAEPLATPLYPQRFVEIMARNRPLSPTEEKAPDTIADVAVGPATAREIGWLR